MQNLNNNFFYRTPLVATSGDKNDRNNGEWNDKKTKKHFTSSTMNRKEMLFRGAIERQIKVPQYFCKNIPLRVFRSINLLIWKFLIEGTDGWKEKKMSYLQVFIETYSEACQTSKKERFAKIANVWKLRTVSAKCSTLNVCQGYIVITTVSSQEKLEELVQCKYSKNWPNLAFLSAVDLFSYFY